MSYQRRSRCMCIYLLIMSSGNAISNPIVFRSPLLICTDNKSISTPNEEGINIHFKLFVNLATRADRIDCLEYLQSIFYVSVLDGDYDVSLIAHGRAIASVQYTFSTKILRSHISTHTHTKAHLLIYITHIRIYTNLCIYMYILQHLGEQYEFAERPFSPFLFRRLYGKDNKT